MSQIIHQQNLHHEKSLQNLQPIKIRGYEKLCNKFFHWHCESHWLNLGQHHHKIVSDVMCMVQKFENIIWIFVQCTLVMEINYYHIITSTSLLSTVL